MEIIKAYHGTEANPFNKFKCGLNNPAWFATDFATAATYGKNVAEVNIMVNDADLYCLPLERFERPGHLSDVVSAKKQIVYSKYYIETTGGKKICIGTVANNSEIIVFEQWFKDYVRGKVLKDYGIKPFSDEDFIHTGKSQSFWIGLVCRKLSEYRVLGDTLRYHQMSDYTSLIWHNIEEVCTDIYPTYKVAIIKASITALFLPLSSMAMGFNYTDDYAQDERRMRHQKEVKSGATLVVNDSKLISTPNWHVAI